MTFHGKLSIFAITLICASCSQSKPIEQPIKPADQQEQSNTAKPNKPILSEGNVTNEQISATTERLRGDFLRFVETQHYLTPEQARKRWGSNKFISSKYIQSDSNVRSSMIADLVERKVLIGKNVSELEGLIGKRSGFFYNDHIHAHIFIEEKIDGRMEVWQLVFLATDDGEILEVKIHNQ